MNQAPSGAPFVVTLDGPAGSGKSTVGMRVAEELGFFYLDTGVLYRAAAWLAVEMGIPLDNGEGIARAIEAARIRVDPPSVTDGRQVDVFINGRDCSGAIRLPEVDGAVSPVAAHGSVREALKQRQRDAVRSPGTVLAGRDIGTVIAPEAQLKIWLTASLEERARRRSHQAGLPYEEAFLGVRNRDDRDGSRANAPMVKAPDAIEMVTDAITPEEVARRIAQLARERGA